MQKLKQQLKQQKHRLHELHRSLNATRRGSGSWKVSALVYEGRFSEAKASLAATGGRDLVSQVNDIRWQMGLGNNCSAENWLSSTQRSVWQDVKLVLAGLALLAVLLAACARKAEVKNPVPSQPASVQQEGSDGRWRLQPHWQDSEESEQSEQSDEEPKRLLKSFLGEEFEAPGPEVAVGVLSPQVNTPTLHLEPARASSPVDHTEPLPLRVFETEEPKLDEERPVVWFAGPEGPRRVLTEAEVMPKAMPKVEPEPLAEPFEPFGAMGTWGFSRTGRWADVLADEETPEPVSRAARPFSEKPTRSQQRRRQRKNSRAKSSGKSSANGLANGLANGSAPRVLQLEQLLLLPPMPQAVPVGPVRRPELPPRSGRAWRGRRSMEEKA